MANEKKDKKNYTYTEYTNGIISIVLIIMVTFVVILYNKNNTLELKLENLSKQIHNKIQIDNIGNDKSFKEDFYITKQEKDTSLILTFFSVGFIVFSLFTFHGVYGKVDHTVNELQQKFKKEEEHREEQKKEFNKIQNNIEFLYSNIVNELASKALKEEQYSVYIGHALVICEKNANILSNPINENEMFKKSTYNVIKSYISILEEITKSYNNLIILIDENLYNRRIEKILSVLDNEDKKVFYSVISNIEIKKENDSADQ